MSLPEKARFYRIDPAGQRIEPGLPVSFNPAEYTFAKTAQFAEIPIPGLDSPLLQYVRGQNETLTMDLFFDSTDQGMGEDATPVTAETDKFYQLVKLDGDLHTPPILFFAWGAGFPGSGLSEDANQRRTDGFKCVVESVRQRFTLFSPTGAPLRAVLTVTLREYQTLRDQLQASNPRTADRTRVHAAQQGQTISQIAGRLYGDPAEWRVLAERNGIDDPLALEPGTILEAPPLV